MRKSKISLLILIFPVLLMSRWDDFLVRLVAQTIENRLIHPTAIAYRTTAAILPQNLDGGDIATLREHVEIPPEEEETSKRLEIYDEGEGRFTLKSGDALDYARQNSLLFQKTYEKVPFTESAVTVLSGATIDVNTDGSIKFKEGDIVAPLQITSFTTVLRTAEFFSTRKSYGKPAIFYIENAQFIKSITDWSPDPANVQEHLYSSKHVFKIKSIDLNRTYTEIDAEGETFVAIELEELTALPKNAPTVRTFTGRPLTPDELIQLLHFNELKPYVSTPIDCSN